MIKTDFNCLNNQFRVYENSNLNGNVLMRYLTIEK